jgi:alpha-beta hydrolase superfamily lysophospholipase
MRLAIFPDSPLWPVVLFVIGYLALALLVYLSQERFLYYPDNAGADMADYFGLRPWPGRENFHGFTSRKPPEKPKGTFLAWHGNAGSALNRTYFPEALERRGYRVILMEYPGYCGRPGKLSEKSFVADALAAVDRARNEFGAPIYLIGESLGCGVATAVAKERNWISGLVLITPWADLPALAQSKFWYLPARWLVHDQYDNIRNLNNYTGQVAVLLAENDEVVPRKHGQKLFDNLKSPKRLWIFPGSGHNSWPAGADEKWWDEVLDFIQSNH